MADQLSSCLVRAPGSARHRWARVQIVQRSVAPRLDAQSSHPLARGVLDGRTQRALRARVPLGRPLSNVGESALLGPLHRLRHLQPQAHWLHIDEAVDPLLVIERDVAIALLELEPEVPEVADLGDVRERHPDALFLIPLGEALREELIVPFQRRPKPPGRVRPVQHEAKRRARRGFRGLHREAEIDGRVQLSRVGIVPEAEKPRHIQWSADRHRVVLPRDARQRVAGGRAVGAGLDVDDVLVLPTRRDLPRSALVVVPVPADSIDWIGEIHCDSAVSTGQALHRTANDGCRLTGGVVHRQLQPQACVPALPAYAGLGVAPRPLGPHEVGVDLYVAQEEAPGSGGDDTAVIGEAQREPVFQTRRDGGGRRLLRPMACLYRHAVEQGHPFRQFDLLEAEVAEPGRACAVA